MSQTQQDHERNQPIQQDVHGENQNMSRSRLPPKPYEPTKEERQSPEATHCLFRAWCEICVKAKSPDEKRTKQLKNPEHLLVTLFVCAFRNRHAWWSENFDDGCDRVNSLDQFLLLWQGEKMAWTDYVMQSSQFYIDRLCFVKGRGEV